MNEINSEGIEMIKLAKTVASQTIPNFLLTGDPLLPMNYPSKRAIPGYYDGSANLGKYHELVKTSRWFYKFDPIASTVLNRMADMAMTTIRNRKKTKLNSDQVDDNIQAYYDALAKQLRPIIKQMALEYLLHGLVVPSYAFKRVRGDLISEKLGRTRYTVPDEMWLRNPENLELKRRPTGTARQIWLRIPKADIELVQNKGVRSDGTEDKDAYQYLVDHFPEYVAAIRKGQTKFLLETERAIMRKPNSYEDYPMPFLVNALSALQHKAYLKTLDKSIASRAIEAIRQIKVGDKDFPADDDDLDAIRGEIQMNSSTGERVFNLFTNHTVEIVWVFPPLEALLDEAKYAEPNADIFLAMGFPRILTTGETLRSNSSDSKIASLGPKATLEDLRESILEWLTELYRELAEKNNFKRFPEPYFAPIATSDYTALVQFAVDAMNAGAISKDTIAQLYGSDFETEAGQIQTEQESGVLSPAELMKEKDQEFQIEQTEKNQEFTKEQTDVSHKNNLETIKAKPAATKPAAK
jgi:hypothetical protein